MWKIDEDASFSRCVLLDGRELEGDWWIVRPLGVLGSSGILLAQDRISGTIAPLTSVMLLVAAEAPSERSVRTAPVRETAPRAPAWQPERLQAEPAARPQPESPVRPAPVLVGAGAAASGAEWGDILRDDVPHDLPELDIGPDVRLSSSGM